jgi:hypothetical protein
LVSILRGWRGIWRSIAIVRDRVVDIVRKLRVQTTKIVA